VTVSQSVKTELSSLVTFIWRISIWTFWSSLY